jgi:hypothetical protein
MTILQSLFAKQGGWQNYEQSFLGRLKALSDTFTAAGTFKKTSGTFAFFKLKMGQTDCLKPI